MKPAVRATAIAVATMLVLGAFLLAGVLVLAQGEGTAFSGQYVADAFSGFMKLLALAAAALGLLLLAFGSGRAGLDALFIRPSHDSGTLIEDDPRLIKDES